jgi:hypothetical protein
LLRKKQSPAIRRALFVLNLEPMDNKPALKTEHGVPAASSDQL